MALSKEPLDSQYKTFLVEYETSMRNLQRYKDKADHIYGLVQKQLDSQENNNRLEIYYKGLTDLTQCTEELRKLNLQTGQLLLQKPTCSPEETFTYPRSLLSDAFTNYNSEGVITHIKDAKDKLFYMMDNESTNGQELNIIAKMQYFFGNNPQKLNRLPHDGEVFGLHAESYLFRAVKENGCSDKFCNFNVFLIDVGEVIPINEDMEMFILPEEYKKLPAQAALCKLEQVNGTSDIDLSEYLKKCLYVTHRFKVIRKERDMLYINLYANTNPFRVQVQENDSSQAVPIEPPTHQIMNPFKRYLCIKPQITENDISDDKTETETVSSHHTLDEKSVCTNDSVFNDTRLSRNEIEAYERSLNTIQSSMNGLNMNGCDNEFINKVNFSNNLNVDVLSQVLNEEFKRNLLSSNEHKNVNGVETLTDEQRKILYEEPLNTTNAMKAVMGYDPKDDKRICPFYNPATKSCFKGASCRLEHVPKIKEGWTRDEAPTIVDIPNQITYPRIGDLITIIPTHVINVENFFGQIRHEHNQYQPTLKELIYKMNSPEIVKTYKVLKSMPVLFELVLAKYTDGFWYRAKILNVTDDDTVKVFYVDYGNSSIVSIDDVRVWDRRFEYLPFQATRCKIVGIGEKRNRSLQAAEQLRKTILNLSLKARVVNNIDYLDLQLWDVYNNDVAEELISMKLVERKETPIIPSNQLLPA